VVDGVVQLVAGFVGVAVGAGVCVETGVGVAVAGAVGVADGVAVATGVGVAAMAEPVETGVGVAVTAPPEPAIGATEFPEFPLQAAIAEAAPMMART
jgi:hypothetical protein